MKRRVLPLTGQGLRPTPLRRRASRPQLKRDPLGSHEYNQHAPISSLRNRCSHLACRWPAPDGSILPAHREDWRPLDFPSFNGREWALLTVLAIVGLTFIALAIVPSKS